MENHICKCGHMSFSTPTVNIKLLNDTTKVPTRGSQNAAGYDLYANIESKQLIMPHTTEKISAGISIELPEGTFGGIFARSGISTKKGLRPANCVGVIDSDYRGDVIVPLHNDTNEPVMIEPNERIAQLIILPFVPVDFNVVKELSNTDRSSSGFGSTGQF